MSKQECDFCGKETDGKIVLKDVSIVKSDGSDIILCSECLNSYANGDYDKIKLKGERKMKDEKTREK